jgi:prevent-host-death family protein
MEVRMTIDVGVVEFKRQLSEMLSRVALKHERISISRHGRPVAVLVSPEEGAEPAHGNAPAPGGLLAAAGAWEGFEEVDAFLNHVRKARDRSRDRAVRGLR